MSENKWSIFKDIRFDSEVQICNQCKKYTETSADGFGVCSFLGSLHSSHQLEWAAALSNIICKGFGFRETKKLQFVDGYF